MRSKMMALCLGSFSLAALIAGLGLSSSTAIQEAAKVAPTGQEKLSPEEVFIRKALVAFVTAFNNNNAKALVATMAPKAEYIDEESNRIDGPAKIGDLLTGFFKDNQGAQMEITPSGIRLLGDTVALEDGEAVVTVANKNSQSSRRISLVYTRIEGTWKITSYREYPQTISPPEPADRLKDLSFLLGEWVDEAPDSTLRSQFTLAKDGSHILREFALVQQGTEVLTGTQRIAVDPLSGNLKGWTFDNAGGHGVSTWTPNGDAWLVSGSGVTAEGEEASAIYRIKKIGTDRIEFTVTNQVVGNQVKQDETSILVRKLARKPVQPTKP